MVIKIYDKKIGAFLSWEELQTFCKIDSEKYNSNHGIIKIAVNKKRYEVIISV